jgi:2'-5' RNA ligase
MSIRLFVGLAVDPEIAERLAVIGAGIPGARWVAARNLHLTLRFIGEVDEGAAHEIHEALATLALPRSSLTLEGFGTFGSRQPHTLWAGVAPDEALERLQAKVETTLVHAGLPPEPRKFFPHVTLARLRNAQPPRLQAFITLNSPFRAGPTPVGHFTLFRSHLSRSGAEYEAVAEYPLGE